MRLLVALLKLASCAPLAAAMGKKYSQYWPDVRDAPSRSVPVTAEGAVDDDDEWMRLLDAGDTEAMLQLQLDRELDAHMQREAPRLTGDASPRSDDEVSSRERLSKGRSQRIRKHWLKKKKKSKRKQEPRCVCYGTGCDLCLGPCDRCCNTGCDACLGPRLKLPPKAKWTTRDRTPIPRRKKVRASMIPITVPRRQHRL